VKADLGPTFAVQANSKAIPWILWAASVPNAYFGQNRSFKNKEKINKRILERWRQASCPADSLYNIRRAICLTISMRTSAGADGTSRVGEVRRTAHVRRAPTDHRRALSDSVPLHASEKKICGCCSHTSTWNCRHNRHRGFSQAQPRGYGRRLVVKTLASRGWWNQWVKLFAVAELWKSG